MHAAHLTVNLDNGRKVATVTMRYLIEQVETH